MLSNEIMLHTSHSYCDQYKEHREEYMMPVVYVPVFHPEHNAHTICIFTNYFVDKSLSYSRRA